MNFWKRPEPPFEPPPPESVPQTTADIEQYVWRVQTIRRALVEHPGHQNKACLEAEIQGLVVALGQRGFAPGEDFLFGYTKPISPWGQS